jgi:hypothetical protein
VTSLPLLIADWPHYWKELYEERAGIIEADARFQRSVAEKLAQEDIRRQFEGYVALNNLRGVSG